MSEVPDEQPDEQPDETPPEPTPDDDEAAEAEDDDETEHEGEQEPPEAQAQGPSQEEWEQPFKKADRSFANYTRNVTEWWEEDATALVPFVGSPSAPPGFL